jgi:hypothetical protein
MDMWMPGMAFVLFPAVKKFPNHLCAGMPPVLTADGIFSSIAGQENPLPLSETSTCRRMG